MLAFACAFAVALALSLILSQGQIVPSSEPLRARRSTLLPMRF